MSSPINFRVSPYARRYIRDKAEELMPGTCRFYAPPDPDAPGTYDPVTGDYTPAEPEVKWTGPCRIWEVQPGQTVVIGDEELVVSQTFLSLPFDVWPLPEHDDIVEILTYPDDRDLVGRTVSVGDVVRGGGLRASRKFSAQVRSSGKDTW